MINHYYRNVHAIVYVYDVTNLGSFENLPAWITECDKHVLDQDLPRILVGNKCDMSADQVVVHNTVAQRFAVRLYLNLLLVK
jgi:Ras-related protein Rab-33B